MELFRALGALAEAPSAAHAAIARSLEIGELPEPHEHTELFGMQLVPYASIYLGPEGRIGGEGRDRIKGFWRALDIDPPQEVDHLTVLLSSYVRLSEMEAAAETAAAQEASRRAREAFLAEHLTSWLPIYLMKMASLAGPFYRRWARILLEALVSETEGVDRPWVEPMHFRLSSPFPLEEGPLEEESTAGPGENETDSWLDALLSPVRSGIVLTRSDLTLAARDLSIGSRMGERRFMLGAMLRQAPETTREWLREYVQASLRSYSDQAGQLAGLLEPWLRRVAMTSERLAA